MNSPLQSGTRPALPSLLFALALGAGSAQAQATLEVGGAGVIGSTVLTTTAGVAKVPASGSNWTTNGGALNKYSSLISPIVTVPTTGAVTLKFTHRYSFEPNFDGGAVLVSVNGSPAAYLSDTAFSTNGYVGNLFGNVWTGGEKVFQGQSADYGVPTLIESVANLGVLTAGDTVSVEFRGGWDDATTAAAPNWEIGTVGITSSLNAPLLNVNFTTDGAAGFTVQSDTGLAGPWTYTGPVSRFELNADTQTADRYAPSVPGSVINLNQADLSVVLLTGTLDPGETFSLFDLSGGTTLTGALKRIALPPLGTWNTDNLATNGTITFVAPFPALTWNVVDGIWDELTANWTGSSTIFASNANNKVTFNNPAGGVVTVVSMIPSSTTVNSAGNYSFITGGTSGNDSIMGGTLVKSGTGMLQLGDSGLVAGNTYKNDFSSVQVNAGLLKYGNRNALGTGTVTLADGTTLHKFGQEGNGAALTLANNIVLNGAVTIHTVFAGLKDQWFSGVISGSGSIRLTGERRAITFTGNSTFSGGVIMENYTGTSATAPYNLDIGHVNALGTGPLTVRHVYNATVVQFRGLGATTDLSADPGVPNNILIDTGATLSLGRGQSLRLEGVISGTGALRKRNTTTVILDGANTYTGGTTIEANAGTLTINGSLADATMNILGGTVNGSGSLKCNIDGPAFDAITMTEGTLDLTALNLVVSPAGAGLTASEYLVVNVTGGGTIMGQFASLTGAPGYVLNYDTANQVKLVKSVSGSPYATWSGNAAADLDTNGDSVKNGVAWVVGAANPVANAVSLMPVLDNASDPDFFIFNYRRSDAAAADPKTAMKVQYSSTLTGWTDAVPGANIFITPANDFYAAGIDKVEVKIRRTLAVDGKLLARLHVVVTP